MHRNWPETLIAAALASLAIGCGSSEHAELADSSHVSIEESFATPEAALEAFVTAWNARDYAGVEASFHPERRAVLRGSRDDVEKRLVSWRIEDPEVETLCHPRGGGWKTTRFNRVDLETSRAVGDAAWLKLDAGNWWMYSL